MIVALVILLVIAFFVSMYYYRSKTASAPMESHTTRVSGGEHNAPPIPGQTAHHSANPGSIPDGNGQNRGDGNAAMSSGMQG
jgi:hypothetical protein